MARKILLASIVIVAGILGAYVTTLILESRSTPDYAAVDYDPTSNAMSDVAAIMETPEREFVTIDRVTLSDDAVVIAIEVAGKAYAFPKLFMEGVGDHIVTDVIEELPLAVTYCNETECIRVFADHDSDRKIELHQQGLMNGGLAVILDGKIYEQDSKEIPLEDYDYELKSWSEWKTENPDGLVVTEMIWEQESENEGSAEATQL